MRRSSILALGAIVAALLAASPASAARVDLAGGGTTLRLNPAVAGALGDAGVALSPLRPARAVGGGVRFPITGGAIDPTTGAGRIDHSGGLRFSAGRTRVALRSFRVHVGTRRAILTAVAGGQRFTALVLDLRRAKVTRPGLGTTIGGVRARLSGAAARALNAAFSTSLFRGGLVLGTVTVRARPAQVALGGGSTALALDSGAAGALASLGISAAPIEPAGAGPDGLTFPITGGKVSATTFAGRIAHSGGLRLSRGGTAVDLTSFTINVDADPDLTALVGGRRLSVLALDLSALDADVTGRRITLSGVRASLTGAAAGALNEAFSTTAFAEGLLIGTAEVRAEAL